MGEHAEYLVCSVIKLPTYDAILGKMWLDRWNPAINWKSNTMQWNMGTILISMAGVREPHDPEIVPSYLIRAMQ